MRSYTERLARAGHYLGRGEFEFCTILCGKAMELLLKDILEKYPIIADERRKTDVKGFLSAHITLVMDNLNTHNPGSLYESFPPDKAKALWDRFDFVYTPKHGSWLNMTEIELNVLTGRCLKRRIDDIEIVKREVAAWQRARDNKSAKVNWQFTAEDARIKLSRLYPTLES